eukprot:15974012-Heterocapsa_arctica.AAC.1
MCIKFVGAPTAAMASGEAEPPPQSCRRCYVDLVLSESLGRRHGARFRGKLWRHVFRDAQR